MLPFGKHPGQKISDKIVYMYCTCPLKNNSSTLNVDCLSWRYEALYISTQANSITFLLTLETEKRKPLNTL